MYYVEDDGETLYWITILFYWGIIKFVNFLYEILHFRIHLRVFIPLEE